MVYFARPHDELPSVRQVVGDGRMARRFIFAFSLSTIAAAAGIPEHSCDNAALRHRRARHRGRGGARGGLSRRD